VVLVHDYDMVRLGVALCSTSTRDGVVLAELDFE
jgi:hypothetical protein